MKKKLIVFLLLIGMIVSLAFTCFAEVIYDFGAAGTGYPCIILVSPDATRWLVTISNSGVITTEAL